MEFLLVRAQVVCRIYPTEHLDVHLDVKEGQEGVKKSKHFGSELFWAGYV